MPRRKIDNEPTEEVEVVESGESTDTPDLSRSVNSTFASRAGSGVPLPAPAASSTFGSRAQNKAIR